MNDKDKVAEIADALEELYASKQYDASFRKTLVLNTLNEFASTLTDRGQSDRVVYWLGQRDMIASIFMWLRDEDTDAKRVIQNLATLYNNNFDGKNEPNPHVEHYLEALATNKTKEL